MDQLCNDHRTPIEVQHKGERLALQEEDNHLWIDARVLLSYARQSGDWLRVKAPGIFAALPQA